MKRWVGVLDKYPEPHPGTRYSVILEGDGKWHVYDSLCTLELEPNEWEWLAQVCVEEINRNPGGHRVEALGRVMEYALNQAAMGAHSDGDPHG